MKLFRGDSATAPSLGRHSYWSSVPFNAQKFAGYSQPDDDALALYEADVVPSKLLDLRTGDPWGSLVATTGIDLSTACGQRQDLVHGILGKLSTNGFDWLARFADYFTNDREHRDSGIEEWIYLGSGKVPAAVARSVSKDWIQR